MELARLRGVALEGRRARRRGHDHPRGGGRHHDLSVCDRLVITLVSLRHGLTQDLLAVLWGVDQSTVSRA
ncbi:MAG: transposase family protein, partial [Acidimicrobiaceae bacterium]|nr:transposase family protein [Acidimicrobiaceae bacterium]